MVGRGLLGLLLLWVLIVVFWVLVGVMFEVVVDRKVDFLSELVRNLSFGVSC